ncbi:hypothetical protein BGV66_00810 [Burkholderia ubonensis]|uniref:Glucose-methanol-choline oxidoreductase N-terminal domain-containing protein n=1 Tax=Burkholderia ubonensis TaxID=101571 RepID=A0ABD6QAY8_9BURK|nr:hypothetical protein BGV66_00810 [Burkholderia ubonensis]
MAGTTVSHKTEHHPQPNDPNHGTPEGRRAFLGKLAALGAGAAGIGEFSRFIDTAEASQIERLRDSYDYVIVGAGSAGCLLADRLSASGASVLLIEAGDNRLGQSKVALVADWLRNLGSDTDWARVSVPQTQLDGRQQASPAGRTWGGSGSINAMIWLRGDPRDHRAWQQLVGPEWNPADLTRAYLQVTQASQTCGPTASRITVGRYADRHPLTAAYLAAGASTGLAQIELNAGRRLDGTGVSEVNATADGRRAGPAQAFLAPALTRQNLKVLSNVVVSKLVLQGTTCRGVEVRLGSSVLTIYATRETIVSAGAAASPQLLMLSGLGPLDQLAPLNIQVRQDMPAVGRNFHDHLLLSVTYKARTAIAPQVSNGVSTMAYYGGTAFSAPTIQVAGMQYPFGGPLAAGEGYTLIPFLAKPRSRGVARLVSADPRQSLALDPNYLADAIDRDTMIAALDRALDIGAARALASYNGGLQSSAPLRTRTDKLAFIRQNAAPGLHFVGSCAAGRDPATSVVDARFRVWGIQNLRVVDASVIPEIPAVNIQPSVLTVAQLAANQLLAEARASGAAARGAAC